MFIDSVRAGGEKYAEILLLALRQTVHSHKLVLDETGEISQLIPQNRASGEWGVVHIQGDADVRTKVVEAFAKNKANHKLEFWSTRDLAVQDDCTFMVYGELLQSYISYKRKSSEDKRFYYKSGELATTATEKLRGAVK